MAKRSAGEAGAQDLSDLEEGVIASKCFRCASKQQVIKKIGFSERGDPINTKTKIGICTNVECFRYLDLRKVVSWVRDDENLPGAQQLGATKAGTLEYSPVG